VNRVTPVQARNFQVLSIHLLQCIPGTHLGCSLAAVGGRVYKETRGDRFYRVIPDDLKIDHREWVEKAEEVGPESVQGRSSCGY
jgi:hypothetical protein